MPPAPESGRHVLTSALTEALLEAGNAAGLGMTVTVVRGGGRYETVYVNDATLAINGYDRDEFLALDPTSLLAPGELARILARGPIEMGSATRFESVLVRKSGERIPIDLSYAKVPWHDAEDGDSALVSYMFDLSARRRTEDALRKSEASLRSFLESAPLGIVILQDERVVFANAAVVRLLGCASADDVHGQRIFDVFNPEERTVANERIGAMFEEGRALPAHEYSCRLVDGRRAVLEVITVPFDYEGRAALLSFVRDVTEKKQLAEQMARVDRLVALGTLAAGVAHEINNPIAIATTSLEALDRLLRDPPQDGSLCERARALVADARGGVQRVAMIGSELRGFSRSDDERRPVDLAEVLASAERMTERTLRARARVTIVARRVPPVLGNAGRLEQVFVNLLLNAAQAMPAAHPEDNVILVELDAEGDEAVASVRDNGLGIAPEHLARIFDPFFTTKPVGEGTGLGLAISHTIITQLGGTITVESELGKGTTFRVRLPVAPPSVARVATPAPRKPARRARILIVDDEPTLVRTLVTLLGEDHEVVGATSGADALALVLGGGADFDLVLCDLMMPYLTGMDLYERLARERPGFERRLVFMTGGAFTPRARAFLDEVPNERFDKPFSPGAVTELLHQMVGAS